MLFKCVLPKRLLFQAVDVRRLKSGKRFIQTVLVLLSKFLTPYCCLFSYPPAQLQPINSKLSYFVKMFNNCQKPLKFI